MKKRIISEPVEILFAGDFYPGGRTARLIKESKFADIFNDILEDILRTDIAIINLESPITALDRPISKIGPAIKASPQSLSALKYSGFKIVTLANNHIMDFGPMGLKDTIENLEKEGILYFGAGKDLEEAAMPLHINIKGVKFTLINVAENEFSTTSGGFPGANPLNLASNYKQIRQAREKSDYVFVVVHGGHENYSLPSPLMKETYRFFVDAGAHAVIAHHSHCFSGYELYNGSPIFYGLGNFIFDNPSHRDTFWNLGFAVKFRIFGNMLQHELIPYYQSGHVPGIRKLNENEYSAFLEKSKRLNEIIQDDSLLEKEFEKYCLSMSKMYNALLEPHTSRLIYALQHKKLLPSLLSKNKRLLYLNLMRCESHREVLLRILYKNIKK